MSGFGLGTYNPPVIEDIDPTVFPGCIVEALITGLSPSFIESEFFRRPLRLSDPNGSMGVVVVDWQPVEAEIGGFGPTIGRYNLAIQTFFKGEDEQFGRQKSSVTAKSLRKMLFVQGGLSVMLLQTRELNEDGSPSERVNRMGVTRQQFSTNAFQQQSIHFSSTQVWVETEIL